jgi:hypothetical protein
MKNDIKLLRLMTEVLVLGAYTKYVDDAERIIHLLEELYPDRFDHRFSLIALLFASERYDDAKVIIDELLDSKFYDEGFSGLLLCMKVRNQLELGDVGGAMSTLELWEDQGIEEELVETAQSYRSWADELLQAS